jgi:hypothetical protein
MRIQCIRNIAVGLVAAIVAVTSMTPAQAATRTHHRAKPCQGWQSPSYLIGCKADFASAGSTFRAYPGWALVAFEQGQHGG